MRPIRIFRTIPLFVTLALSLVLGGCSDDNTTSTGSTGSVTPDQMETLLLQNPTAPSVVGEALGRLQAVSNGQPEDGTTFQTDNWTDVEATVALDLDDNGTRETTIAGNATVSLKKIHALQYQFDSQVNITGADSPFVNGTFSAQVMMIGGGGPSNPILYIYEATGSMSLFGALVGEVTDGPFLVEVTAGHFTLDLTFPDAPFLTGFVDFRAGGMPGTCTWEDDGDGGYQTCFSGDGWEFTIP